MKLLTLIIGVVALPCVVTVRMGVIGEAGHMQALPENANAHVDVNGG